MSAFPPISFAKYVVMPVLPVVLNTKLLLHNCSSTRAKFCRQCATVIRINRKSSKMMGVLQRRLQATGVTSSGLMHRLMGEFQLADTEASRAATSVRERCHSPQSTATYVDSGLAACTSSTGGGVRGLATGSGILCGNSKQEIKCQDLGRDNRIDLDEKPSSHNASPTPSPNPRPEKPKEDLHSSPRQRWWLPDPVTGTWVPQGLEGQVTTSTDATKPASRQSRHRADLSISLEDKRWWTSMEELPDMDRGRKR